MPAVLPTPLSGTPVKMVIMTNYRQWGWSDVLYYSATGGTAQQQWSDIGFALADAARAIDFCHADGCDVLGARAAILDVDNNVFKTGHQSNLYSRADMLIPDTPGSGPPESPWAAILFDLTATDFSLDRRWLMRGWPAIAEQKQTAQGGFDPGLNATITAGMGMLQRRIFGPAGAAGSPPRQWGGQFAMKARDFRPGPSPFAALQRVGTTASPGYFTVSILTVDDWGAEIGDRVLVEGTRLEVGKGPAGLSVISDIEDVAGVPAMRRFTLAKKWPYTGIPVVKTYGQVRKYAEGLFPLNQISFERFVKRDTGRPFFGTRGRR